MRHGEVMKISYRETARIAESLAYLLKAGVPTERIFATLLRHCRSRKTRDAIEAVRRSVESGRTFHEGFSARPKAWPSYFIELVRCAEMAGMLYAGFEEGAEHFRKLARVWRSAHMLWMSPAIITVFGWVIIVILWTYFVGWHHGYVHLVRYVHTALRIVVPVLAFLYVPPLRKLVDGVILLLPIVGPTVRDLSLYQFTSCFRYLYIGAVSAQDIVRHAARAAGNTHLRAKLTSAVEAVQQGHAFAEALGPVITWPEGFIGELANAEVSGQLEGTLDKLAQERKEALETRVNAVRQVTDRLFGYATVLAIVLNLLAIFEMLRARGG